MRRLTFEEREAGLQVPTQLKRDEVSSELRAVIWHEIDTALFQAGSYGERVFQGRWGSVLRDKHVYRDHRLSEFQSAFTVEGELRKEVASAPYQRFFGLLEYLLRHPLCSENLHIAVDRALVAARSPYRILDRDTIAPLASEELLAALTSAVELAGAGGLGGARQHLKMAASHLGGGEWASSVRESIHAVESVALVLSPGSDTLGPALKALSDRLNLHEALKKGFLAIYGFASDESGIRHALLDNGDAAVDETDALFMLGACSAFVSYLVSKGRSAGLLS